MNGLKAMSVDEIMAAADQNASGLARLGAALVRQDVDGH
jgi:hypothetical protein